ncbi:ABC transporter permease [Aquimonas voraii]|uniref:Duplicated orphan permease n=1 Tax=Aquimonas voraii TaxID=265719 RepID=A0A1G6WDG8_9GAMM|nr:ABC transporter permease [Aquimonas voraii]SDD63116.1 duplicated orphan permease [Aquimonas voraii]
MNLHHALRGLLRTPVFSITVVLTLAVGMAAATAMFAIVYGILLAPLPFREPERLVSIGWESARQPALAQPLVLQSIYRSASQIEAVGFYRGGQGESNLRDESSDAPAQRIRATWVGPGTLDLLGVAPLLGRFFTDDEHRMDGGGAVILSEAEWRARYGADPTVLGRTLLINEVRREIVGVMPARFAFPSAETRLWLPGRLSADAALGDFSYAGVARLKPGASPQQLQQELGVLLPGLATAYPRLQAGGRTQDWLDTLQPQPRVALLHDSLTRGAEQTLGLLAAAGGLLLLVSWANVMNLMLIRANSRRAEQAIRQALGAHGLRGQGQQFAEPLLLAMAAAALVPPLAAMAVHVFAAFAPPDLPRLSGLGLNLPSLGVGAALALVSALLCAASARLPLRAASLSQQASSASGRARTARVQGVVVAAQFAVALAVTAGAVLLLRSAQALQQIDPGFSTAGVTTLWTQLPFARYDEACGVAFYSALSARARELPGVEAAGLAQRLPLAGGEPLQQTLRAVGGDRLLSLPINAVDDHYFAALQIPVLAGRGFARSEHEQVSNVVLNRSAASALFGDADSAAAVGRQLALDPDGPTYTVVGVVADVRDRSLTAPPQPTLYRPPLPALDPQREPAAPRSLALLLRSQDAAATEALVESIRAIVRELDPGVPVSTAESLQTISDASTAALSLGLRLLSAAAALALLLGSLGLYGAMAYTVALRRREFGVRAALGAAPLRIARLVMLQAISLAVIGIGAGLGLYALLVPSLRSLLYGVGSLDMASLAAAVLILLVTAVLAGALPARQAARIAPMEALRQ